MDHLQWWPLGESAPSHSSPSLSLPHLRKFDSFAPAPLPFGPTFGCSFSCLPRACPQGRSRPRGTYHRRILQRRRADRRQLPPKRRKYPAAFAQQKRPGKIALRPCSRSKIHRRRSSGRAQLDPGDQTRRRATRSGHHHSRRNLGYAIRHGHRGVPPRAGSF